MKVSRSSLPFFAIAVIIVTAAAFHLLGRALDSDRRQDLDDRAREQAQSSLESQVIGAGNSLRVLAASIADRGSDRVAFRRSAATLLEDPSFTAITFVERVSDDARASFESRVGAPIAQLNPAGDLVATSRRATYWPIATFARTTRGPSPLGLDVASSPTRLEAIERATVTGAPAITRPVDLVGGRRTGSILYAPVLPGGGPTATDPGQTQMPVGFVGGIYDLSALGTGLSEVLPVDTAFVLTDGETELARAGELGDSRTSEIEVAGRLWTLAVDAPDRQPVPLAILLPALGTLLAAMLAGVISSARQRERYAQALVTKRMAERDVAEAERVRAEQEFTASFDESPIGIALVELDGTFRSANASLCELLGRPNEELQKMRITDFALPDDAPDEKEAAKAMIAGDLAEYRVEKRYMAAGGNPVWLSVNAVLIRDAQGEPHHYLAHVEDVTERRNMRDRLQELADLDDLTGLFNRRGFSRELERKLFECERYGAAGALLVLDLDDMKGVNDGYGHASGDALLRATADALREGSRRSDIVGRVGGDEFAVILPRGHGADAGQAAHTLLAKLGRERRPGDGRPIAASVGVVAFSDLPALEPEAAMNAADLAMYEAKRAGGRQLSIWDG